MTQSIAQKKNTQKKDEDTWVSVTHLVLISSLHSLDMNI